MEGARVRWAPPMVEAEAAKKPQWGIPASTTETDKPILPPTRLSGSLGRTIIRSILQYSIILYHFVQHSQAWETPNSAAHPTSFSHGK
jgi:hypothetical protein